MSDPGRNTPSRWRELREKHQESQAILAIAMAAIVALFVIGIVTAFNDAANDTEQQMAHRQPAVTAPQGTPAPRAPDTTGPRAPETTGQGGENRESLPDMDGRPQQ